MRLQRFGAGEGADYEFPPYDTRDALGLVRANVDFVVTAAGSFDPNGTAAVVDDLFTITAARTLIEDTEAELQVALDAARAIRGVRSKLWARTLNDELRWLWARCVQVVQARQHFNNVHQPVTFFFQTNEYRWRGHDHTPWTFDAGEYFDTALYLDEDGWIETMTAGPPGPHTITVTNGGNKTVRDAVITITAGAANITSVTIESGSSDFTITDTILAGNSLVIDCGAFSVLNNGVNTYTNFSYASNHAIPEWLLLPSGNTDIDVTFAGGSTDSTVTVAFMDGWS